MPGAASDGAKVVWVGMPPMKNAGLSAGCRPLDAIYQAQAAKRPAPATSTPGPCSAPRRASTRPTSCANGQEVNVREPDGTHIAPGGAELLSQAVIGTMRDELHIQLP